jgi:hypothetical protein
MTHVEHIDPSGGYFSTINFYLNNTGDLIAKNVAVNLTAFNNTGVLLHSEEIFGTTNLPPSIFHVKGLALISLPFQYNVSTQIIYLEIIVKWIGGSNAYAKSYNPKIMG